MCRSAPISSRFSTTGTNWVSFPSWDAVRFRASPTFFYLKGVDLGIIRADTLDYLQKKGYAHNLKRQLTYITKLYNEEMHVVAPKSIKKLSDLAGKTVSVDLPNGGTFITAMTVFERLGIKAKFKFIEERLAYEKLRKGEIDAMVAVQGRPSKFIAQIKDDNLHFVPIDYAPALQKDYLPAQLTAKDYPTLIAPGQRVDTIVVPAILAAHNWRRRTATVIAGFSSSCSGSSTSLRIFSIRLFIRNGRKWC